MLGLEWRKMRALPAIWLIVVLPVLLIALLALSFQGRIQTNPDLASGGMFIQSAAAFWGVFLGTPLCLLLSTFAITIERPMWQQLRLQGLSISRLVLMKILTVWLFNLLAMIVMIGMLVAATVWLGMPSEAINGRITLFAAASFALLPMIALQIWLNLRLNHFLLTMGIGMTGHFLCLFVTRSAWGGYLPWAPTLEFLQVRGQDARTSLTYFAISLLLGLVLTGIASLDGSRRLERE